MAAVTSAVLPVGDSSNVETYASTSWTPTAGDFLVVFAQVSATGVTGTCVASANGITFTKVNHAVKSGSVDRLFCFVANQLVPSSPSAMTVTMTVTGDAGTGGCTMVAKVTGMTKVGAAAVRQHKVANNLTSGTTPTITFDTACLTGNPTLIGNQSTTTAGSTPPGSWTERFDGNYSTPTTGAGYVSRDSGFTGTGVTWGGNITGSHALLAIELDASADTPVSGSDTGTGDDAVSSLVIAVSVSDTGAAVDSGVVDTGAIDKAGSDTGSGLDAGTLVTAISVSDIGTSVDASSLTTTETKSGSDTGTGVDTASVAATEAKSGSDTGTGVDTGLVAAAFIRPDTGVFVDASTVGTVETKSGSDVGVFVDTASVQTVEFKSGSDVGTGTDTASVATTLTRADTGIAVDTASVAVLLAAADIINSAEHGSVETPGVVTPQLVGQLWPRGNW